MQIAILGASGATGKQFTTQALAKGHHVTVLVRSPQAFDIKHPQLEVMTGDALNPADVKKLVNNQDAIFCALGTGKSTGKSTIRRQGTQHIINALSELGKNPHLVILSSLGVGDSKAQMSFFVRLFIPLILRNVIADHQEQEKAVTNSNLTTWTIIRPSALNDGNSVGYPIVTMPPQPIKAQPPVTRADVAMAVLDIIENHKHIRETITLSSSAKTK